MKYKVKIQNVPSLMDKAFAYVFKFHPILDEQRYAEKKTQRYTVCLLKKNNYI